MHAKLTSQSCRGLRRLGGTTRPSRPSAVQPPRRRPDPRTLRGTRRTGRRPQRGRPCRTSVYQRYYYTRSTGPGLWTTGFEHRQPGRWTIDAAGKIKDLAVSALTLQRYSNYSTASNNMKLVHWPLMSGLLHLVQRGWDWVHGGRSPLNPLLAVPNVTAHPSTASVPINVRHMYRPNGLVIATEVETSGAV